LIINKIIFHQVYEALYFHENRSQKAILIKGDIINGFDMLQIEAMKSMKSRNKFGRTEQLSQNKKNSYQKTKKKPLQRYEEA